MTLCPIKNHSSIEIMTNIFRNYISKWCVPIIIITDQEKSFSSEIANDFYKLMGIKKNRTVAHRPEADGQSEAYVKVVSNVMAALFTTYMRGDRIAHPSPYFVPHSPHLALPLSPILCLCSHETRGESDRDYPPHHVQTL